MISGLAHRTSALIVLVAAAACAPAMRDAPAPAPIGVASEIETTMVASADAWNAGNLEGFLRPFHPSVTYVSGDRIRRGLDEVREMYREAYFADGRPPRLTVDRMESRALGDGHVLTTGRWRLATSPPSEGLFTVVLVRSSEGWRIVHDHSS